MKFIIMLTAGFTCVLALLLLFVWIMDKMKASKPQQQQTPQESSHLSPQQIAQYTPTYTDIAQALVHCASGCYYELGLRRPGPAAVHMDSPEKGIRTTHNRVLYAVYLYRRNIAPLFSGNFSYSTVPVHAIRSVLNQTFPQYCVASALGHHSIINVKDLKNGRVRLIIC